MKFLSITNVHIVLCTVSRTFVRLFCKIIYAILFRLQDILRFNSHEELIGAINLYETETISKYNTLSQKRFLSRL